MNFIYKIINRANINIELVESLVEVSNIRSGKLLLILHDHNINTYPNYSAFGCFVLNKLLWSTYFEIRKIFEKRTDKEWNINWTCGIALSSKICELQVLYPAYFSYILGHERDMQKFAQKTVNSIFLAF